MWGQLLLQIKIYYDRLSLPLSNNNNIDHRTSSSETKMRYYEIKAIPNTHTTKANDWKEKRRRKKQRNIKI